MRSMEAARAVPRTARNERQNTVGRQQRAAARRVRRRNRLVAGGLLAVALTAAFAFAARTADPGMPGKGALLLGEEFDGSSLDSDHWSPCYHWATDGCTNLSNRNLQWYIPDQVKVGDGKLSLEARPEQVTGVEGRQFDYVSGLISGASPDRTLFAFKYGYVESRVKIPEGKGLWPALWMLPTTRSSLPEIDIFEIVGEEPNVLQMHTHWEEDGEEEQSGKKWHGPNFSEDWHTFGLEWKPDSLTWYVDGVERWHVTDPAQIPHEDMYLITNLAVGGEYTSRPDDSTKFPAALEVDYVRVWGAPEG
jgi:beta-glucanase (GH16 family)